jgi:deazaflavin-dependent oxidoreductase (nitroreductase family)
LTLFWRVHRAIFRATRGRLGARFGAMPVLLLTSRGHKSGERRDVTLNYLRDDGSYVVIASFVGADKEPSWWRNLRAHPEAEVMVDGRSIAVRASEAEGARRELLWARIVAADRAYDEYQQRTARRIAVVLLEPIG